jgi:hypothetical protein
MAAQLVSGCTTTRCRLSRVAIGDRHSRAYRQAVCVGMFAGIPRLRVRRRCRRRSAGLSMRRSAIRGLLIRLG